MVIEMWSLLAPLAFIVGLFFAAHCGGGWLSGLPSGADNVITTFAGIELEDETKVPFLGDLPAIGNLFKSRSRTSNKQEMLVFITPKVIAERATR